MTFTGNVIELIVMVNKIRQYIYVLRASSGVDKDLAAMPIILLTISTPLVALFLSGGWYETL